MPINVNDGGVLRTLGEISANDGGVLKKLGTVHANDGGVLRQMFSVGTPISNYSVGSVVKIKENGVAVGYIIAHKGLPSSDYNSSCNGIWLLRQRAYAEMAFDASSEWGSKLFSKSEIRTWLNGTFLNTIDATVRGAIKTVNIPNNSLTSTLSSRIFLLSAYEVGAKKDSSDDSMYGRLPIDGAPLSYFSSSIGNQSVSTRIARNSGNTAVSWWTRSANQGSAYVSVYYVNTSGGISGNFPSGYNMSKIPYVRPAFILPNTVKVDSNGYIIV